MYKRGNKLLKLPHGAKGFQVPAVIAFLIVILIVFAVTNANNAEKPSPTNNLSEQKLSGFEASVRLQPTVEFINRTNIIWQIPDSPKAALFLAHGCNGKAANFWDKSPICPNCIGLPEERLIVLNALARKYAVLTVSSKGRCWTFGKEISIVEGIIKWWVEKNKLGKLPLLALGASSGGYFVSVLATDLRFSSITLMIAEGLFDEMEITEDYPPTLFVHMPKDQVRKVKIRRYMNVLRRKRVDVSEVKCTEFPLSPIFLSARIPGLDQAISTQIFVLFREKGFVDKRGYMTHDGRATRWKEALEEKNILFANTYLVNHIQEELNLAFAYHEMTSLPSGQIFDWFESHLS